LQPLSFFTTKLGVYHNGARFGNVSFVGAGHGGLFPQVSTSLLPPAWFWGKIAGKNILSREREGKGRK